MPLKEAGAKPHELAGRQNSQRVLRTWATAGRRQEVLRQAVLPEPGFQRPTPVGLLGEEADHRQQNFRRRLSILDQVSEAISFQPTSCLTITNGAPSGVNLLLAGYAYP